MWRRLGIGIAVIVVIIVVAAAVAPYFIGRAAESDFKAQLAYLDAQYGNQGYAWHVDSYHRGFYGSETRISMSVPTGLADTNLSKSWAALFGSGGKPELRLHISHGPIPFAAFGSGHWNFTPVLYTVEFRGRNLPASSVIGTLKLNVYIVRYFAGDTNTRWTVPPGRFGLGVFGAKWQGGHVSVQLNARHDRARYEGMIKPVDLQFKDTKSRATYDVVIEGGDFSVTHRKARYDLWVGPGKSSFDGLAVSENGSQIVTLAGGHGVQRSYETDNGRWLNATAHGQLNGGTIRGWDFSKLTADSSISRLNARGFHGLADSIRAQIEADKANKTNVNVSQLASLFALILKPATEATYRLNLVAPSGRASLDAHAGFAAPATPATGSAAALALFGNANARVDIRFDRKLARDFSIKVLGASSVQSADAPLQMLVSLGYLKEAGAGGSYQTRIEYRGGRLTVNGRNINVPAQAAQSAGAAAN